MIFQVIGFNASPEIPAHSNSGKYQQTYHSKSEPV
jgi:hypothetical protein